jgi:hypothetical protein
MQSKQFGNGNIVFIVLIALSIGVSVYWFNSNHANIYGQWRSLNNNHTIAFFDDGTMNIDGLQATYKWVGDKNIRIQMAGIAGSFMQWLGGDLVVQVKLKHELLLNRSTLGIKDTLAITRSNGDTTEYSRL